MFLPRVSALFVLLSSVLVAQTSPSPTPIVLEGADRRPATSLDGDWHIIVDPYFTGLYSFHNAERKDGFFENKPLPAPGDNSLVEYSFAKGPTLHVPGDWNTQRPDLFFYEGPLWYQRDINYTPQPGHRTFLHVGAANYHSFFWINGTRVCEHEGGFTTFDCDATAALKPGANSIVVAVDNTRHPDGSPHPQNRLVELRRPNPRPLPGRRSLHLYPVLRSPPRPRHSQQDRRLGAGRWESCP